ncbi:hypothetical protein OIU34_20690 [Pararhizobium sp. BT-229]|uniref:hypothetical protein n=1 Tax=Pararhizobium sp. BT-229 TaxID=2986923 RepID=UPI0021F6ED4F|nr:hypothetical protein [Pararhizobium sp. BT-229]MCV9964308.1 hypothetical protein [Pararhizobium sp. BT-229]
MTSYSTRPIYNDLADGDQVILRKGYQDNDFRVVTLRGSERGFTHAVADDETEFEFKTSGGHDGRFMTPCGERWTLYFSYPLPDMPVEDRIAYARAMLGEAAKYPRQSSSDWDNPVVFLIEDVNSERVLARMVSHEIGYLHKDQDDIERLSFKMINEGELRAGSQAVGSMWTTSSSVELDPIGIPEGALPGRVVVATNIDVEIVEGRAVTKLRNPAMLPGTTTLETVTDLFPSRSFEDGEDRVFGRLNRRITLEPIGHWLYQVELARHALDTDEALVVVFPDPDNPGGSSEHIAILTSKGAVFYADTGYAHDQISGHGDLMPGVVHITEVSPWAYSTYEGEHDAGIDFADARADEATLAHFGLDIAGLGALIRGFVDEEDVRFNELCDRQLGELMMSLNQVALKAKADTQTSLPPAPAA